jgi:hypothetical protein
VDAQVYLILSAARDGAEGCTTTWGRLLFKCPCGDYVLRNSTLSISASATTLGVSYGS